MVDEFNAVGLIAKCSVGVLIERPRICLRFLFKSIDK